MKPCEMLDHGRLSILFLSISLFSITVVEILCVEDTPSQPFSHVILFSWDGVQYNHLRELYDAGNMTNLEKLVNETQLPILKTLITDHYTETNYGHPSLLSGVGQGQVQGCPDNITVWENIEAWNSSWVTASIAGKAKFSDQIFPEAKDDVDYWYANDVAADVVTDLAIEFVHNYSAYSFFMFVHYREPDLAAHSFGENSQQYGDAIVECDNHMGRILYALQNESIHDSTAILVTTDHGFAEGGTTHSGPAWGAPDSDPNLYTVWIACSVGTVNLTEAADEYWDQNDVAPTIYSLVGLDDYAGRWQYIRGSVLWERAFNVRDVAITNIQLSRNVTVNENVLIDVLVENQGNYTEIPTVSVYYDDNLIETKTLAYPSAPLFGYCRDTSEQKVIFAWNTENIPPGIYTITAKISIVPAGGTSQPNVTYTKNETDTADNTFIDGTVAVQQLLFHQIVVGEVSFQVATLSNSNVTWFNFSKPDMEISFNITAISGTCGFCNVTIPKALLNTDVAQPWRVFVDGMDKAYEKSENSTLTFIYFTCSAGTHKVEIVGTWVVTEFPTFFVCLLSLLVVTVFTVLLAKKNQSK